MSRTNHIRSAFLVWDMMRGAVQATAWGVLITLLFSISAGGAAHADCSGGGDCCQPNGSPGCSHLPCCESVCALDPFCCEMKWDQFCTILAFDHCTVCSIPGDLNNDGVVDGADLLILLSHWGDCENLDDCPADLNGDGVVDGADLLIQLNNWG